MSNKIDFTTLNFGNYSLNEQDTGFTWIDGKNIYKKTINFGVLPSSTEKRVAHNISNIDWVIASEGFCKDANGNHLFLPAPSTTPITLNVTNEYLIIATTSDMSSYTQTYFTVYYTKTS